MGFGTALVTEAPAFAQNQNARPLQSSDLGRENQSRVAASAGEIKPILLKDSGLMVELKRWVAKDATDHGQIITDADLTNEAIFDRLENDVQFRAVATLLLQKYGYLVPQVNPNSEVAKEQQLLMQERIKWITQEEEEARQQQHAEVAQAIQKARSCATGVQTDCVQPQARITNGQGLSRGQQLEQQLQQGQPESPLQSNPNGPTVPNFPFPNQGTNPLERAQLMQTGADSTDSSQFGMGGSIDALQALGGGGGSGLSPNLLQQLQRQGSDDSGSSMAMGGAGRNLQGAAASLLLGGADLAGSLEQNDINPFDTNQSNAYGYSRSAASMQAVLNRRNQQGLSAQSPQLVRAANPYQDIPSLYDMYLQASPRPITPKRFGMEVFENAMQDPSLIPMDLPSGPDYVVGPGDGLAIDLWGGVSRKFYRTVDREGRVSIPEVGPLLVSGKSLAEVQQNLQQVVRTQFRDESADVSLGAAAYDSSL